MWKSIREFFLGALPPPRPAPIQKDIGKIVATIYLQDGTTIQRTFVGENKGWTRFVGDTDWFPYTNNARFVYDTWLNDLAIVKGEHADIPFHQVVRIEKTYSEYVVTVQ